MAAQVKVTFKQDLTEPVKIRHYEGVVFTGDDCGNLIKVALFDGGVPYSGGGTVSATAVLADGTTFPLTQGSITGNMVSVPLEAGALVVSGLMGLYVKISGGGIICTVLNAIFTVQATDTGMVPAAMVTTVNELVQEIKDAQDSFPADLTNLLAAVAPTFSTSVAYSAGAYVWQGGKLYRFTAAHQAGTWTGTDAAAVALGNDVSDLKSAVDELLPSIQVKSLVFNRYGLSTQYGATNSLNNRLHTAIASAHKGDIVSVPDGYSFWIAYYSGEKYTGNSYEELGNKWSVQRETISHDGLFALNIKKDDDSVFTRDECYNLNDKAFLYSTSELRVGDVVFGVGSIDTANNSTYWGLKGNDLRIVSTQAETYTQSITRWRTEAKALFREGTTVEVANGYRVYIIKYTDGGVVLGGWQTESYTFSAETIARLIIDTVSDDKVVYSNWPDLNDILVIRNKTDNDITALKGDIERIDDDIIGINNKLEEIKNDSEETLYIGDFVNGHLTASGVVDDKFTNYRISTPSIVAFPYGDKTSLKVSIDSNYLFAMRVGATANNLNNNLFWYKDGDTITLPSGVNYYAVSVCKDSSDGDHLTYPIAPTDNIMLKVVIQNSSDVVARNVEAENVLSNARLFFSASELNTIDKYAIIGHTSDCHGDYKRVDNFLDFCDNCGADVACITGDIVSYKPSQQIKWFNDLLLKHDVLPAVCAGNHDVYDANFTDSDIYDFMFADVAVKIGNTIGKTWYYKDIDSKKIRIISVNLYQYGGENRWYTHFTNEQLSWIVSTMASAPNGYGIIILSHAAQVSLNNEKDSNYGTFFQDVRLYNNTHNAVSGGVPLYDIVDAFISRSTLDKTYTQTGAPSSISVSADFTGVDASVEFIAHLTGHFHQDSICYVPRRTNRQLMLNVTCTNAIYGGSAYPYLADIQDQARYKMDATQDAFNVYVIDRDNKIVKVVRVGNNKTYQMQDRQYMEIPY